MMKKLILVLCVAVLALSLSAQEPAPLKRTGAGARSGAGWEFSAWPTVALPLVRENDSNALGLGGGLALNLRPAQKDYLTFGVEGLYTYGFLKDSNGGNLGASLSEVGLGLSAAAERPLGDRLAVRAFVRGGLLMGTLNQAEPVTSFYGRAESGLGLDLKTAGSARLFADVSWEQHFGLYGALSFRVGSRWVLQSRAEKSRPRIYFGDFKAYNLFPVLYSWYDDHSFGEMTITNQSREPLRNLRGELSLKPYADQAKECFTLAALKPGQSVTVKLFSLLNPRVMDLTEPSKASVELTVAFQDSLGSHKESRSGTVSFMDRNAITWDDDRKAAAFVSGKDPWVLDISNNVNSLIKDLRVPGVNANYQTALAVHQALQAWGISYVHSPQSPFSRSFENPEVIDYLKFPRQTLMYKAGDCADLSVLYASFFESLGIGTAFITVPGHIFMAIDLEMNPAKVSSVTFSRDLIVQNGKVWLPIETTLRDESLTEIVHQAAQQWQREYAKGTAAFYDIHEAWQTFPPVGLADDGTRPGNLDFAKKLQTAFTQILKPLADKELAFQLGGIDQRIKADLKNPQLHNARGVVLARFGRFDEAAREFTLAATSNYPAAMINMVNLSLLRRQYADAKEWYNKAKSLFPENAAVISALARIDNDLALSGTVILSESKPAQRGASQGEKSPDWME